MISESIAGTTLFGKLAQHFLPSRDRFTLPLGARLLVVLTLLQLGENPRLLTFPLEAAKRILERLVFFDVYERHSPIPPLRLELFGGGRSNVGLPILGLRPEPVNPAAVASLFQPRFNAWLRLLIPESL